MATKDIPELAKLYSWLGKSSNEVVDFPAMELITGCWWDIEMTWNAHGWPWQKLPKSCSTRWFIPRIASRYPWRLRVDQKTCVSNSPQCLLSHKKVEINFGNHWTSKIVTHHKWVEIKCNSMMPWWSYASGAFGKCVQQISTRCVKQNHVVMSSSLLGFASE